MEDTHCLQTSENAFIGNIPIYLKFSNKSNLSFETSGWLAFNSFIREDHIFRCLKLIKYRYDE
jgi:hypothetical protein